MAQVNQPLLNVQELKGPKRVSPEILARRRRSSRQRKKSVLSSDQCCVATTYDTVLFHTAVIDSLDQLAILTAVSDDHKQFNQVKKPSKETVKFPWTSAMMADKLKDISDEDLAVPDSMANRANPVTTETRSLLEEVLTMIRDDMESSGSFGRLSETVFRWNQTKSRMEDRVRSLRKASVQLKDLRDGLALTQEEKVSEVKARERKITELKSVNQQLKMETKIEKEFTYRFHDIKVKQEQKKSRLELRDLEAVIEAERGKIEAEKQCHSHMMNQLTRQLDELNAEKDNWTQRYSSGIRGKTEELSKLRFMRIKNQERLHEIKRLYAEYEEVCVEERELSRESQLLLQRDALMVKSAVRIQKWWRELIWKRREKKKKGKKKSKKRPGKGLRRN